MTTLSKLGTYVFRPLIQVYNIVDIVWVPAQPAVPARCQTVVETIYVPIVVCDPPSEDLEFPGNYSQQCGVIGYIEQEVKRERCTPAQPAVEGHWRTIAELVEVLPATYVVDDNEGWNSAALGIPTAAKSAELTFTVPHDTIGALVGFSYVRDNRPLTNNINFGFLIGRGFYELIQNGQKLGTRVAYTESDEFKIARRNGVIHYYVNDVLIHIANNSGSVTIVPNIHAIIKTDEILNVDSALYIMNDAVVDAALIDIDDLNAIDASMYILARLNQGSTLHGVIGVFQSDIKSSNSNMMTLPPILCKIYPSINLIHGFLSPFGATLYSTSELIEPLQKINGIIPGFKTDFLILESTVFSPDYILPAFDGIVSQGQGIRAILAPFDAKVYEFVDFNASLEANLEELTFSAILTNVFSELQAEIDLEELTLESGVPFQAELTLEELTLEGLVHNTQIKSTVLSIEDLTLTAVLERQNTIRASLNLEELTVTGGFAAIATINLEELTVTGGLEVHALITIDAGWDLENLTLEGTLVKLNAVEDLTINLEELTLEYNQPIKATLNLEELTLTGYITSAYNLGGLAYVLNLTEPSLTTFSNYNFETLVNSKGKNYGIKDGKLYKLTGDTDEGLNITGRLLTHNEDRIYNAVGELVPNQQLKKLYGIRVSARTPEAIILRVIEHENTGSNYITNAPVYENRLDVYTADTHRGIKSQYRQYGFYFKAPFKLTAFITEIMIVAKKAFSSGRR